MKNSKKRTALIIGASILGGGVVIASTALITKAIVESRYNKNTYKVFFNGYKCHLSGDTTVKKGSKFSALISSDDENYDPSVYSVRMNDKDVDYTFTNGHLIINTPATGDITINAIATDRAKVYATGKFNKKSDNTYEVTGIDTNDLSSVTDLYIPSSYTDPTTNEAGDVTSIKEGALYGLSNLQNLTIPFIGTSKDNEAANARERLFGIIFGNKLFEGVRTLTWQYYNDNKDYIGAAIPSSLETVIALDTGKVIERGSFNNCSYIKEVDIQSENSTSHALAQSMFEGCSSLEKITYPDTITTINKDCFKNCSSLISADFTSTEVTTINESAFDSCSSLQRVKIPNKVGTIGLNAFANLSTAIILCEKAERPNGWNVNWLGSGSSTPVIWNNLNPASLSDGNFQYLKVDDNNAFVVAYTGSNVSEITIPATLGSPAIPVTHIGPLCFTELTNLKTVDIQATGIKTIGSYAFKGCTALESINLKTCTNLNSLGVGCFYECNQLKVDDSNVGTNYFLPTSLTNIGNYCFYDCYHILNINAASVKYLGDYSFAYCCYNYIDPLTGDLVFSDTDYKGNDACLKYIKVSTDLLRIGSGTFMNARELKTVSVVEGTEPTPTSVFNNIPDFCFYHTKIGSQVGFKVTSTLETIGAYAFGYCSSLSKLDFSDAVAVKSIGEGAFINCGNVSGDITLPSTLESIGAYAFEECVKLESLNIKSTAINYAPFDFCFDCESLKSVSFAGDLVEIDDFAFGGCKSLTTFNGSTDPVMSNSLYSLGNYAFSNCSSLNSIKLSANASLENGLNIGSNVFAGWTEDQTIKLNKDLFDYYKKAKTVKTKFGWEMTNRTKIFGILTDKYSCEASGSSNVIIQVE